MRKSKQLIYGQNEPRNLLATIALNAGELLVGGTPGNDVVAVSFVSSRVLVDVAGEDSQTFPRADVSSLVFVGLGGDDSFTNNTSIPSTAFGQAGNDTLIGGSGNDRLIGGSGNDVLTGNAGDDEIRGGAAGNKTINGNAGNDRLFGGNDTNNIFGGDGDDLIFGGASIDIIEGNDGDDQIFPGNGDNVVDGGGGADEVVAGLGVDQVTGGDGNDLIFTGGGDDTIDGGDGDDWIGGGDGDDTINGDAGADRLRGGAGGDTINGGSGVSTGRFDIQTLGGGDGDDVILGGADAEFARGDGGNDEIDLGAGDDAAFGGDGDDEITLGTGNDFARGDAGDDTIFGNAGDDNLFGNEGDDRLVGGSGRDSASYFFNQNRYRIAGSDLIVRDLVGDDGEDDVDEIERLRFTSGAIDAVSQIEQTITIQPIIASNSNGTNTAEFFGTDEEEAAIKSLINDIYYQARIEVRFLAERSWNNTFANVGSGGTRPANDAFEIFDAGEAAGLASSDPLTVNMYFIEIVPGNANLTELQVNGLSLDDSNGVTFQVGDDLPGFEDGREAVARVAAHEIAHNIGLEHVAGSNTNLMNFPNVNNGTLTARQINTLKQSAFSR